MKNEVIIGDCAEVLKPFPDESIDCIVTDPPYGYSFMGLEWDKALPSLEALKECNRVLKAGAFGFFMCAPRQDVLSRMIIRLEDAGFNVGFSSIYWSFASGFPKAQDISKMLDKRAGAKLGEFATLIKKRREELGLTLKDVAQHFPSKTGGLTGCVWNWENRGNVPTIEEYNKLIKILKLEGFPELNEAEREVIANGKCGKTAIMGGLQGKETNEGNYDITAPATNEAKQFAGSFAGFQPKPSLEIILTVMKPLECKTYVDQALKNGHGISWLGNCRIPYENESDIWNDHEASGLSKVKFFGNDDTVIKKSAVTEGRFPANLLVSDSCLDRGIITKSSFSLGNPEKSNSTDIYKYTDHKAGFHPGDSGDFSRYFSLDAWFDKKISELPEEQQKTFPFLITPKPSKSEKNKYIENKHPTVKPLKLMSYLITLGSREGDVILDPFAGSGTTLEACKLLNRVFIGIDIDPTNEKYMIARSQLNEVTLSDFPEVHS